MKTREIDPTKAEVVTPKINEPAPLSGRNGSLTTDEKTFSSNGVLTTEKMMRLLAGQGEEEETKQLPTRISLENYFGWLRENPTLSLRPSPQYIFDAIDQIDEDFGGKQTVTAFGQRYREFRFLELPWKEKEFRVVDRFRGHPEYWNWFYNTLKQFATLPHPKEIVLGYGPHATGKSNGFKALFEGINYYSKTKKGPLYMIEWVFGPRLAEFGFRQTSRDDISPIDTVHLSLLANKNTSPFYLYPVKTRAKIINDLINEEKLPKDFNIDFVLSQDLDEMSKKLYEGLIEMYTELNYKNPKEAALRHVRVSRYEFSNQGLGRGLIVKHPITLPNTAQIPIMPEVDWSLLPPEIVNVLSKIGLSSLQGDYNRVNGGVHYTDDGFRNRGSRSKESLGDELHLLYLGEKGSGSVASYNNLGSTEEIFDVVHIMACNSFALRRVQTEDPTNWEALRDRIAWGPPIGHERCPEYVESFLQDKLNELMPTGIQKEVSPNTINAFSKWVTMTHLLPYANEAYYDNLPIDDKNGKKEALKKLLPRLTLLDKLALYSKTKQNLNGAEINPTKFKFTGEEQELLH